MRFVEKWPSRMQGQWFFWKSKGVGKRFRVGPEISGFFVGQLPLPISTSPERLVGGKISSSLRKTTSETLRLI